MTSPRQTIPVDHIKECFVLEDGGIVRWKKVRPAAHFSSPHGATWHATRMGGKRAGRLNSKGYLQTTLTYCGRAYKVLNAHIVWVLTHGHWPVLNIDHINRVRTDNRPENLRDVTHSVNMRNKSPGSSNTANHDLPVGVYSNGRGRYRSQIQRLGSISYLGTFDTPNEAAEAYVAAHKFLHSTGAAS